MARNGLCQKRQWIRPSTHNFQYIDHVSLAKYSDDAAAAIGLPPATTVAAVANDVPVGAAAGLD